jgi:hypothetical protein
MAYLGGPLAATRTSARHQDPVDALIGSAPFEPADESINHDHYLYGWGHSGIRGKNGPSREGRFRMRFKITIQATGPLPAGAVTCTP